MKAIIIRSAGGPDVLELREVEAPLPGKDEVAVRVHATAVNRADLMQRMGRYPAPPGAPPDIPGLELAGEIAILGEGVRDWSLGDRVYGLVGGGAYAEQVIMHARTVVRIPEPISFTDAAAVPEAFVTAYDALVVQAHLGPGEIALVHAVGSGVGTAAVQIANAVQARAIGTARTESKLERATELGMSSGILVNSQAAFAHEVLAMTGGRGADVVLDLVGGAYVDESLKCLASKGRILVVGLVGGSRVDLDLARLLQKRGTVRGTVLRGRPLEEKIEAAERLARNITPMLVSGAVRPVIAQILPLAAAAHAHALMESNDSVGKIVLSVSS